MNKNIEDAWLYYADNPYDYCIDILNLKPCSITKHDYIKLSDAEKDAYQLQHKDEVTWQQKDILGALPEAIEKHFDLAVKSGHGIGKTAIESMIINWFLDTHPLSKVICTAPSQHQLYDVLWSELSKWHRRSVTNEIYDYSQTSFKNKKYSDEWFAVARTSNKPENMQGFHGDYILFIVDEASGVAADILEAIEGTKTQSGSIILYFGNPTQLTGNFFDAFHSKRTFYKNFSFNSEESPIVGSQYYRRLAAKYGHDSDVYRVRVLGDFPKAEPDTLISLSTVEAAAIREVALPIIYEYVEIGVDVARFGNDETTIFTRIGDVIFIEDCFTKKDTMFTAGRVVQIRQKYQYKNAYINVDDGGVGGGVTDRLNELVKEDILKRTMIFGVNNGGSAKDEMFFNCGTEMWFFMRQWLLHGKIPNDPDLMAQLSTRRYGVNSKGKNVVEEKQHMKERGLTSPDRADGAILTLRSLIHGNTDFRSRLYVA